MKIRRAVETDIPEIAEIYGLSVVEETASFELVPPTLAEMTARMKTIVDGGYPYLVAEIDGAVVGYAYASAYRPREAYRHTVENTVYVAREVQGMGVGKKLVLSLVDACRDAGFKQMIGVIGGADHTRSISLHRACGFEQVGHLKSVGYKHDRWLDSILMQRAL